MPDLPPLIAGEVVEKGGSEGNMSGEDLESIGGRKIKKPHWIRIRLPADLDRVERTRRLIASRQLHTICEESGCPNLTECFGRGTATFMILGKVCTRRCPFCGVSHGRPSPPESGEPIRIAQVVREMGLRHVILTSVNRDDLEDGGARHFSECVEAIRLHCSPVSVETLVPDFRGRSGRAIAMMRHSLPDVFAHNLESVPRLYRKVRPGADYRGSLQLLEDFRRSNPHVPTKSGLMVGLGERRAEISAAMRDLFRSGVSVLTVGQYLQPSEEHIPVARYLSPEEFAELAEEARAVGFGSVRCGPLVRSSYRAGRS